jgi:hypothetical protein
MSTCIISRNCSKNRRRDVRYILVTLNILRCINEYFLFNNFYIFTVQKRKIERLEHLLLIKFHMESLNWFSSAVEEICFWYIHAIGIKSTLTRYRPPSSTCALLFPSRYRYNAVLLNNSMFPCIHPMHPPCIQSTPHTRHTTPHTY